MPVVLTGIVLISGVIGGGPSAGDPARGVLFGVLRESRTPASSSCCAKPGADLRGPARPPAGRDGGWLRAGMASRRGALLGELDLTPGWNGDRLASVLLALSSQVVGWLLISVSLPRLPAAVRSGSC